MASVNPQPPPAGGVPPEQEVVVPPVPAGAVPLQQPAVAPAQPVVYQQPAAAPQPVVYQQPAQPVVREPVGEYPAGPVHEEGGEPTLRIYSHSTLIYWWPVWAAGFLMALLSYFGPHQQVQVGDALEYYAHSSDLGIFWLVALFLVILITNVPVRGLASGIIILGIAFLTVLFAYFDWWGEILWLLGHLSVHMNLGAYLFISALLFVVWLLSVFVFDHMSYWQITPGQVTRVHVFGAGATSFDTRDMVLEKHRNDFFRHWVLGLGAGDLKIRSGGANRQDLNIPNVMFVGQKVVAFQRMIATKPAAFPQAVVRG